MKTDSCDAGCASCGHNAIETADPPRARATAETEGALASLLARAVDRLPWPIIWPIIVALVVAGAIAIPLGLLWLSDSTAVPSISQYSGPVASVSSDPKFGTHITLHGENGVSPDIFFDGVVLEVRVGDRATVWAENQANGEWGLKFVSDRETWIDPAYGGDLTNPPPPYGL